MKILSKWSVLGVQVTKTALQEARDAICAKFTPDTDKHEEQLIVWAVTAPKYQASLSICRREVGQALL